MNRPAWDVVILGGGTAGCATALSLRRAGVNRVVVIERRRGQSPRVGESIPPDTQLVFRRLGVWENFAAQGHEPCVGSCSAWGSDELAFNDFLFNPNGTGWHLDRPRFDGWLAELAVAAGAELRIGARFDGVQQRAAGDVLVRLATGYGTMDTLSTRVVVDATGSGAYFARAVGARRLEQDRMTCVTRYVDPPQGTVLSQFTLLEAVEYGWWYAARVPDGRIAVAVASDPEIVSKQSLHTTCGWRSALESTRFVGGQLTGCELGDAIIVRSVRSSTLDRVCGPDWLAVGDAASAYDPMAARGIHAALDDGEHAGRLIAAHLDGDPTALPSHQATVTERFADYRANRDYFYRQETRWPAAPFWVERRARSTTESGLVGART